MAFETTQQLFDYTCLQMLLQGRRCSAKSKFFYRLSGLRSPLGLFIRQYERKKHEPVSPHIVASKLGSLSVKQRTVLLQIENAHRASTLKAWRAQFNAIAERNGLAQRQAAFWGTGGADDLPRDRILLARSLALVTKDFEVVV